MRAREPDEIEREALTAVLERIETAPRPSPGRRTARRGHGSVARSTASR